MEAFCCEKGQQLSVMICPECEEVQAAYSAMLAPKPEPGITLQCAIRGQAPTPTHTYRWASWARQQMPMGGHIGPSELPWPHYLECISDRFRNRHRVR